MRLLISWIREARRREIILGIVLLTIVFKMLESWLDFLAQLGAGPRALAWGGLQEIAILGLAGWGLLRDPGKWGCRIGWIMAAGCVVVGASLGMIIWFVAEFPDQASAVAPGLASTGWRVETVLRLLVFAVIAAGAISLRRLYPAPVSGSGANRR